MLLIGKWQISERALIEPQKFCKEPDTVFVRVADARLISYTDVPIDSLVYSISSILSLETYLSIFVL